MSTFTPGQVDQPLEAAEWLSYFRRMNEPLIKELDVGISQFNKYISKFINIKI